MGIWTEDDLYLDRKEEICISEAGYLPHWHQEGKMQFVTFRLADSLPQSRIQDLNDAISDFKFLNPQPWDNKTKANYVRLISKHEEVLMHREYGECILAKPDVRAFLSQALRFKDNIDYKLIAYVIMPNHVHMLFILYDNKKLNDVMRSIKGFSARQIGRLLNREGGIWMREYYDRIIRNEDHYKYCLRYIIRNPAKLPASHYELYVR